MSYTREQYTQALLDHLPSGKIYNKTTTSNIYKFFYSLAGEMKKVDDYAENIAIDWQPGNTTNFLFEWQKSLGLPDRCVSHQSSFEDQRNQVVSRLTFTGGSTTNFIKSFCESLGYEVDVKEWGQMICGVQSCNTVSCGTTDRANENYITINITNNKEPSLLLCEITPFIPPYIIILVFENGIRKNGI
ncbi:putative phage tail protein [Acetobacter orientalis]|uniref:putative phage tail protein n=1 Tax=Acetobacter orientalis TaxID=146474 RepID=UPI000A36CE01|nr:putative phage tail protein [Acetobacter orientalis]